MSDTKAIFSEGVTVTDHGDGMFSVRDNATGLYVAGVKDVRYGIVDDEPGLFSRPRHVFTLTIDSGDMQCTLLMDTDTRPAGAQEGAET